LYESELSSFYLITFSFAIFWRQDIGKKVIQNIGKKVTRKMLMKLTQGLQMMVGHAIKKNWAFTRKSIDLWQQVL